MSAAVANIGMGRPSDQWQKLTCSIGENDNCLASPAVIATAPPFHLTPRICHRIDGLYTRFIEGAPERRDRRTPTVDSASILRTSHAPGTTAAIRPDHWSAIALAG
jgi:hypothetical protein